MTRRSGPPGLVLLVAAVALAGGCRRAADLETVRLFEQANRRLVEGSSPDDFAQAAALFEQTLARGGENGAVLHGLGNAWFQAGRKAPAIAAWRRALVHRPRDPFLRANLEQALGRELETELDQEPRSLLRTLLFWQDDLSYGEKAWLLTGSVALACLSLALARLAPRTRGAAKPIGAAATLVAALAAISFAVEVRDRELTVHGVVAEHDVVARKGNAESFEPAFNEPLAEGTELVVLEERGGWLRVRIGTDLEGWVPADRVVRW